jgi:hypothetical protein
LSLRAWQQPGAGGAFTGEEASRLLRPQKTAEQFADDPADFGPNENGHRTVRFEMVGVSEEVPLSAPLNGPGTPEVDDGQPGNALSQC